MLGPGLENCSQRPWKKPCHLNEDPLSFVSPHLSIWPEVPVSKWVSLLALLVRLTVTHASKAPVYSPGGKRILSSHTLNSSEPPWSPPPWFSTVPREDLITGRPLEKQHLCLRCLCLSLPHCFRAQQSGSLHCHPYRRRLLLKQKLRMA